MKIAIQAGFYRLLFMGFNFLAGLFIAAFSGADLFGIISLMVVNAAVFHIVSGLGFDSAIVWHGASGVFHQNKLFTAAVLSFIVQFLLFLLVAAAVYSITGGTLLSRQQGNSFFIYELVYFTGIVLIDKYSSVLYSLQKPGGCNRVLALVTFLCVAFLFVNWYGWTGIKIDPFIFFCCFTLLQGLALVFFFHFSETIKFSRISRHDLVSFFGFSSVVFITNLIQFFAYRADYWLIDYFNTTDQVGIYAQANRFAQLLWVLPNIIAALLAPVITSPKEDFRETQLVSIIRMLSLFNFIIAGFIILAAFFSYHYFLQQEFTDGFMPLLYMLPGFYFFTVTLILAAYFSAKKNLWINFTGSVLCLLVILSADIILIPVWGIRGAAWANTIAYIVSALFSLIMFIRITKLPPASFFAFSRKDWQPLFKT